ncbi:MAG: hypothetical protein KAT68_05545 [Bacteroidales bacterium]|nr:hypothetical protein [Bacteroidales bacterium]
MKKNILFILMCFILSNCNNYLDNYQNVRKLNIIIFNGWDVESRDNGKTYSFSYYYYNNDSIISPYLNYERIYFHVRNHKIILPAEYEKDSLKFYKNLSSILNIENELIKIEINELIKSFYKTKAESLMSHRYRNSVISLRYKKFVLTYYPDNYKNEKKHEYIKIDSNWYYSPIPARRNM